MACSIVFWALKISERKQSGHLCLKEGTYIVVGMREAGGWEEVLYAVLSNFILLLLPIPKVEGSSGWGYASPPMFRNHFVMHKLLHKIPVGS